jgi:hypothetical protein
MKLNKYQHQRIRNDFKCHLNRLTNNIYKMRNGNELVYFIVLKRKEYSGVNFTSLIYKDKDAFDRLMRYKCNGSKKVLFVVNKSFHWLSL